MCGDLPRKLISYFVVCWNEEEIFALIFCSSLCERVWKDQSQIKTHCGGDDEKTKPIHLDHSSSFVWYFHFQHFSLSCFLSFSSLFCLVSLCDCSLCEWKNHFIHFAKNTHHHNCCIISTFLHNTNTQKTHHHCGRSSCNSTTTWHERCSFCFYLLFMMKQHHSQTTDTHCNSPKIGFQ